LSKFVMELLATPWSNRNSETSSTDLLAKGPPAPVEPAPERPASPSPEGLIGQQIHEPATEGAVAGHNQNLHRQRVPPGVSVEKLALLARSRKWHV
jgi:hypothetical protein